MWYSKNSNREYTDEELACAFLDGEEEAQNLLYSTLLSRSQKWWPLIHDNPDDDENQIAEFLVSKLSYVIYKWLKKMDKEKTIPLLGYIKRALINELKGYKRALKKQRIFQPKYQNDDDNSSIVHTRHDGYNHKEDETDDNPDDDGQAFGNDVQISIIKNVYSPQYSPLSLFPIESNTFPNLGLAYALNIGAIRLLYEKWPITSREGVPDSMDDFLDWIDWSNEKWDLPIKGEPSCTARTRLTDAFEELKAYCHQHVTNETLTNLKIPDGDWFSQVLHISRDAYYKQFQRIKQKIEDISDTLHVK